MHCKIREIGFADRIEYHFPYICSAVLVADVDLDSEEEVVASSRDGFLCVFRLNEQRPFRSASGLGLISTLAVGDVLNKSRPSLCSISADGTFHAFQISHINQDAMITALHSQMLQANIKAAFIADIDGDGQQELLVGLTDRVIRSYRYVVLQNGVNSKGASGRLLALNKWEVPLLITCISLKCTPPVAADQFQVLSSNSANASRLLISQSSSHYVHITPSASSKNNTVNSRDQLVSDAVPDTSICYHFSSKAANAAGGGTADGSDASTPVFVHFDATELVMFSHTVTDVVSVLCSDAANTNQQQYETIVRWPTMLANLFAFGKSSDALRMLCGCDWQGQVYFTKIANRRLISSASSLTPSPAVEGANEDSTFVRLNLASPVTLFAASQPSVSQKKSVLLLASRPGCGLTGFWMNAANLS